MSFSKVYSAQCQYLKTEIIDIEIDISTGLHSIKIVGLTDKAVEESSSRVSSAIKNSGYKSPKQKNQKLVISLAPAHVKKNGSLFDLGIALAYLKASKDIDFEIKDRLFIGELSLNGNLRPVTGILPMVKFAKESGYKEIFLPLKNTSEASLISGIKIFGAQNLNDVINHINTNKKKKVLIESQKPTLIKKEFNENKIDFSDIKGQEKAKRGLEIAAAGGHNIAFYGPPGTGKTMLAKAFSGILPLLNFEDIISVTSIYSVSGLLNKSYIQEPPFRSPHHTSSYVSIFGGGNNIKPGEITLAHKGVLFLDEIPEFEKRVIEGLRQPLEDKEINISRAKQSIKYPSNFILITTMNPCPCGYSETGIKRCSCNLNQILNYKQKISGPIRDRIDIWIEVNQIDNKKLLEKTKVSNISPLIRSRVESTRLIQLKRFGKINSDLTSKEIEQKINLDKKVKDLLINSAKQLELSPRSVHKIIKIARTIADLEPSIEIKDSHILEALQYRPKV